MGANVNEITDSNFDSDVLGSDKLYLLDFWATWCKPCLAIAPHVEALAGEMSANLNVGKIDIDASPGTPGKYGVRSIPTLILFKDGQPVDQIVGAQGKDKIEAMIRRHI